MGGRGVGGDESTCCCELEAKPGTCIDIEFAAVGVLAAAAGFEASLAIGEDAGGGGGGGRRSSSFACACSTANAEVLASWAAMAAGGCT